MTEREVLREVARLAGEKLEWSGPLEPRMRLVEDLGLDSLKMLTLAVEVENRFRVCLEEEEEAEVETIGDLVALVRRKLAAPGGRRQ